MNAPDQNPYGDTSPSIWADARPTQPADPAVKPAGRGPVRRRRAAATGALLAVGLGGTIAVAAVTHANSTTASSSTSSSTSGTSTSTSSGSSSSSSVNLGSSSSGNAAATSGGS